jgi:hypothetical protein
LVGLALVIPDISDVLSNCDDEISVRLSI